MVTDGLPIPADVREVVHAAHGPVNRTAATVAEDVMAQPPAGAVSVARRRDTGGWRDPWWKPAIGIPVCALAGALIIGGLAAGAASAVFQGLEVALLGMLVADAWGLRQKTPLLRSSRRRRAALGWALTLLVAVVVALLIPAG
ncbi:MAG TPA: hypothetical protein VFS62_16390 [Chloroflexota bacterium]|jgi:hypothetical protein|nr:hypothetical protein [Chloroflexota bacterium]